MSQLATLWYPWQHVVSLAELSCMMDARLLVCGVYLKKYVLREQKFLLFMSLFEDHSVQGTLGK